MAGLSARDEMVLGCLFSPDTPAVPGTVLPPAGSAGRGGSSSGEPGEVEGDGPDAGGAVAAQQRAGIALAEAGRLTDAIAAFTAIIQARPARASAYNDRAQAQRLNQNPDAALADVAAGLACPGLLPAVRRQLLVQRGMLRRLQGDDDAARADMEAAAALGSGFAKQAAVQLNPYAALCNQMLAEATRQLHSPAPADDERR